MKLLLIQFVYLQLMDLLTTLAFLMHGGREMNPIVDALLRIDPVMGLVVVKGMALVLGVYCVVSGRRRLLSRANAFYAFLIAWNLVAIIAGGSIAG
jgi:hypothetical protein